MIQVQIASHIHALGVDQVRWVLIEPTESASPAIAAAETSAPAAACSQTPAQTPAQSLAQTPAAASATASAAAAPGLPARGAGWALYLLKGLLMLVGLLLALWLAEAEFGPPRWPGAEPQQPQHPLQTRPPPPQAPQQPQQRQPPQQLAQPTDQLAPESTTPSTAQSTVAVEVMAGNRP